MKTRSSAYNYIRQRNTHFIPRTPSAALQAALEGILPIEAFIYKSTGLNPILKKPYNLDEIEWLLSRNDRDLETNLLLHDVLTEISQYPDKEVALFAAESLNAIEKEYNSRLVSLKRRVEEEHKPEDQAAAAEIQHHLALLNRKERTLSHFYLKEAYLLLTDLENTNRSGTNERYLLIRILITLKLYNQAERILPDAPESRIIRMELAYEKRDIRKISLILNEMQQDTELTDREKEALKFWAGRDE